MDHVPHVCSIPPRELLSFCTDQAYSCRLEPRGSLLIPPDVNVSVTDWERLLRLREGQFSVLDAEPERLQLGMAAAADGAAGAAVATVAATAAAAPPPPPPAAAAAPAAAPPGPASAGGKQQPGAGAAAQAAGGGSAAAKSQAGGPSTLARYSGLSGPDLEEIRARLETLLPQDG